MRVRIRFGRGPRVTRGTRKNRHVAMALAALLTPAALLAGILALWRLAADLQWTSAFAITSGLFSHWQVWLAASFLLQLGSVLLSRYGRGGEATP